VAGAAVSFIVSLVIEAIADLLLDLVDHWARKAAEENAKEFDAADANSMVAWKHFPW